MTAPVKRIHARIVTALLLALTASCDRHPEDGADLAPPAPDPVEPLPGIERIELARLALPANQRIAPRATSDVFEYRAALAVPDAVGGPAVAVVPHRCLHRFLCGVLTVQGMQYESLTGESYEVARDVEGKRILATAALGRGLIEGKAGVRAITVLSDDKFDSDSWIYWIKPWPMTEGITLQSRSLTEHTAVVHTRDLSEGWGNDFSLFAVGDCNSDRDDDFVLVKRKSRKCLLVSGRTLETLGEITMPGEAGFARSELTDLDGDSISEVFVMLNGVAPQVLDSEGRHRAEGSSDEPGAYCVVSPGKRSASVGRIDAFGDSTAYVRYAGNAGQAKGGAAQVALVHQDRSQVQRIFVVDVRTGASLAPIGVSNGFVPRHWRMICGRIAGGDGRRWMAWSATLEMYAPPRLFAAEIGVADSTVEIELPADGRAYAETGCAVPIESADSDALAITVVARMEGSERIAFDPVLFLDLSRWFARR